MSNALINVYENKKYHNFSKLSDIIALEVWLKDIDNIISGILGNTKVKKTDGFILGQKKYNLGVLDFLLNNTEYFTEDELRYLKEDYKTYKKENFIVFLAIELILLLKLYNSKVIDITQFGFYLNKVNYVPSDFIVYVERKIENERLGKGFIKNTNVLITNKNSYEFPRDLPGFQNRKIKNLLYHLNLPLIELPKNKHNDNVIRFIEAVLNFKTQLKLKQFNFSLRIKKTNKNKQGFFIKDTNTIIVDPRYPNVFIHELGHYIYENKLAFTLSGKRFYPCHFQSKINSFKRENKSQVNIGSIEQHSCNSELFALWFEEFLLIFCKNSLY